MSKITEGKKRFVRRALRGENPTIRIGKCGATQQVLGEIKRQLDKNKMVKIKILKTALAECETKQMASRTAEQTGASLVEVRGHTFMLYKAREK